MKKTFSLLLVVAVATFFVACKNGGEKENENSHSKGKLVLNKLEFTTGEEIVINYETKEELGTDAWIGIIPSDIEHGKEMINDQHDIFYEYFTDKKGVIKLSAPSDAGSYDVRMHNTDNDDGIELASVSFSVK